MIILKQERKNISEEQKLENLRIRKTQWVQDQIQRQREAEDALFVQMKQEQEVLDALRDTINQNMECSREARKYNQEFQESMDAQVFAMYGITQDKLQGMREYKNAYYRGCAFSLFLLSVILVVLCGVLHGFHSEICLFMTAFTGIQGTLLAQDERRSKILNYGCKILYLFMFPLMMVIFVCYELKYPEYDLLLPIFTIFGMVVLVLGTLAYFLHNPYRGDSRMVQAAKDTIRDIEKTARREIKKNRKTREKSEKKDRRKKQRTETREKRKQKCLSHFRKKNTNQEPKELEECKPIAKLVEKDLEHAELVFWEEEVEVLGPAKEPENVEEVQVVEEPNRAEELENMEESENTKESELPEEPEIIEEPKLIKEPGKMEGAKRTEEAKSIEESKRVEEPESMEESKLLEEPEEMEESEIIGM